MAVLAFSGVLSAFESALFSLDAEEMESFERQGRRGVISARALLTFRDETLMTLLVLDYVLHLAFVVGMAIVFSHFFPGRPALWALLSALVSVVAILLLAEYGPRAIGRRFSISVALALARPMVGLTVLAAPIRWIVLSLSNAILQLPSDSALEREIGSEEELKTLISSSDLKGGLEEDERELIDGVVEFGAARVGDIMTPRPEIRAISDDRTREDVLQEMRSGGYNRVLVYRDDLDHVCGVLHAKELLLNPDRDYHEMLRPPLVIPESKSLMDLLREFRRERVHLAVVCDEFGRTAGVVTMHDLLEEIVGELIDENRPSAADAIRPVGEDTWMVPGRKELYELREEIGVDLPDESRRTVSGFVTTRLERIPVEGDKVEVPGFRLTVERMGVRRIALLKVEKLVTAGQTPEGEATS